MRPSKIIGPIEIYESQPLGSGSTGKVFRGIALFIKENSEIPAFIPAKA